MPTATEDTKQRKIPAHSGTHAKLKSVADLMGWSLTTAVDRITDYYIREEGLDVAPKHAQRRRERLPATAYSVPVEGRSGKYNFEAFE